MLQTLAAPGVDRVLLVTAHAVSWRGACAMIVVTFVVLAYRLLAERERRKTLEATYRYAPAGTIVFQGEVPGSPQMWIQIGGGQRPEPTDPVTRTPVTHGESAASNGRRT